MKRAAHALHTPLAVFTLLLLAKYYGLQWLLFDNANLFDCLLVAVPSLLLFTIPVEFGIARHKTAAYLLLNLVLSAAMVSVLVYFRQFGIVVTYHAFMQAHQVLDVSNSILDLLQPLYMLFFADVAAYLLIRLFRVAPRFNGKTPPRKPLLAAWCLSIAAIVALGLAYDNLLNELKKAERMGLVGYQAHTIVNGLKAANASARAVPITPDAVRLVKNIELKSSPWLFGAAEGRNIVVVQLESFQNFLVGLRVGDQEITPTLNALRSDSYYFSNIFQQVGQGNTADAEFIVNTGFYPPAQQAASQSLGSKLLPSLPRLLDRHGYTALTLHTNEAQFWNRTQLYPALGFDRYYDKSYFGEEDIIAFGPSDEVLYEKTVPVLTALHRDDKPFYAHVIAQSSHHPFVPPETKEMIPLPEQWEGTDIGNYLKMANYADRALGQFIDLLKQNGLWETSVLVVYGDHFGVSSHALSPEDRELLEQALGHEYDLRTAHNIPLFISVPGITDGGKDYDHLGGQLDIMATIANLAGVSLQFHVQFGQDLLNYDNNILGSRFYLPTGSFYNDEIMYISGETFGEGTVIPLKAQDPILEGDPMLYKDDFVRIMRLMQINDAYMDSLPERH